MFRRIASRKGTALSSSAKSPEGKQGQWSWLTSDSVATYSVSGPQDPPPLKKRQNSHYRNVWGQSRSLTSDDLWKVNMRCQWSDLVISWPKSCVISPFLSMGESYVAHKMISLNISRRLYRLWCDSSVAWLDSVIFFLLKIAQKNA